MPFWWERLGLVFKAWFQMVGATCKAKEEEKKRKKLDSIMPRPDEKLQPKTLTHLVDTHTHTHIK